MSSSRSASHFSRKYSLVLVPVTSILLLAGVTWGFRSRSHKAGEVSHTIPLNVNTREVTVGTTQPLVTLAGIAEPIRRATPSARIMARVLSASFHDGQRVGTNQILVRLDTRDLTAKHRQASAGRDAASTALEVAEANLRRMQNLVEAGAASQTQLEAVEVATAQARAATKTARAAIDEVDVNVSYASVASPFEGIVVQKMTEAGNIVGPGQPLFIVEDDSRLRVVASIGSEDARDLVPGQSVRVRFGDESRDGALEGVMSSGDARAPGLRVQVIVDNPDRRLRPGSQAVVEIPGRGAGTKVITVPKEAIVERGQLTGVFVVGDDKAARLRWLILGDRKDNLVMVLSGLREKERVVLGPAPELSDGDVVQELNR